MFLSFPFHFSIAKVHNECTLFNTETSTKSVIHTQGRNLNTYANRGCKKLATCKMQIADGDVAKTKADCLACGRGI